jgi:hypothetical protein
MSTEEATPAPEAAAEAAADAAPETQSPPTLRATTFDDAAFTMAEPLPPSLPDLPPEPHVAPTVTPTNVAAAVPLSPATAQFLNVVTTPPPTASQPLLMSELLETGGASVVRRVFSMIGLVVMAVFLGATMAGAVAGIGLLITLAAHHAGG